MPDAKCAPSESLELLVAAFEALPRAIVISDFDRIVFANTHMCRLLGYEDRSAIVGSEYFFILHPDVRGAASERNKALRTGAAVRGVPVKLITSGEHAINARFDVQQLVHEGTLYGVFVFEPTR
jgi:PAS domain S-box-containing protein